MDKKISCMNEKELAYYNSIISLAKLLWSFKCERLYTCKANIYYYDGYYLLQSYNTLIAALKVEGNVFYDFLRTEYGYTYTSMQHICKFRKWLKEKGLYNDSTVNVRFIP